ncbi:MAG: SLC17 family MFS transporter, partial [Gammaproteobacteria bacterium]|nr:SLC17 family MFS transporter [Gammaproteobacteria bacterium]
WPNELCEYKSTSNSFRCQDSFRRHVFAADGLGLLLALLPLGAIINRYGSKYVLAGGVTLASIITLVIPPSSRATFAATVVLRVIFGFCNATGFPSIYYICSRWAPKKQLGLSLSLIGAGYELGPLIFYFLSGVECGNLGWEYVFYISGAVSLVTVIPWLILTSNDPSGNRWISEDERKHVLIHRQPLQDKQRKGPAIPWFKMVTSPAVLSCCLSGMGHGFVFTFIRKYSPIYYRDVLGLSREANGFFNAIPYGAQLISRFIVGPLSDRLKLKSQTITVKLFNTTGWIGISACFIGLGFVSSSTPIVVPVLLISLTMASLNVCLAGWQKAPLYLAPQFCSTVSTVMLLGAASASMVTPYIVDAVVATESSAANWPRIFFVGAGLTVFVALVFLIFGKAKLRKWAVEPMES